MFIIHTQRDKGLTQFVKGIKPAYCALTLDVGLAQRFATRDQAADVADGIETYRHDLALSIEEV